MGHIELSVPVTHIWFFKCMPSRIGLVMDVTARNLERVIYYEDYLVVDPGETPLEKNQLLTEMEYRDAKKPTGRKRLRLRSAPRGFTTPWPLSTLMRELNACSSP
jgi:DNA-directed RNA polymerase subunit beta'